MTDKEAMTTARLLGYRFQKSFDYYFGSSIPDVYYIITSPRGMQWDTRYLPIQGLQQDLQEYYGIVGVD